MNLPLNTDAHETDIVNIFAVVNSDGRSLNSAWIYVNRSGRLFLEVRRGRNADASRVLAAAGARRTANTAGVMGFLAFIEIPPREARGLLDRLRQRGNIMDCFSGPLH
ncbi:MAG TPA: hypothetical protein VGD01_12450 [Candidatus Elarobacter sp.]|jgi:hypothetical protein